MNIQILELIEGAKKARGLTVIIDVFRAFTTECYAFDRGASICYPAGELEEAFALKREDPSRILLGERGGAKVEGCDLGNSPWDALHTDFSGKEMVHSTSAGTQGIVNASRAGAEQILTGSLVNAKAVASYILTKNPEQVSLVAMGKAGLASVPEDLLAARYIKALLTGESFPLAEEIAYLKDHGGEQFFDPALSAIYPTEDYPLCVAADRFPFVLKADRIRKGEQSVLVIRRIDPPFLPD